MVHKSTVVCRRSARNGTHTVVNYFPLSRTNTQISKLRRVWTLNSSRMSFVQGNCHSCLALGPSSSNRSSTVLPLNPWHLSAAERPGSQGEKGPAEQTSCHSEGSQGSAALAPRAGQLPPRGREMSEEWGGARKFTSSLNSPCPTPGQGWEEQPPVAQKLRSGCYTGVSAWHSEEKYWSLDSVLPCSF